MLNKLKINNTILIWLCITMFYCYQYILRLLPNMMMPDLMNRFGITSTDFGVYAGVYYCGYIIFHLPIGILLAKFSGRIVLPICVIVATLGLIPVAYLDSWNYVILGRFLTGIGSSAAIIGAFHFLRIAFPDNFTRSLGVTVCVGLITAVYAMRPISLFLIKMELSQIINILSIIGVLIAIFSYYILPVAIVKTSDALSFTDIKAVFLNPRLILVAILSGMMVGPMEGFADAWGSSFISTVYNLSRESANSIVSFILIGMCVGSVLLPYIADKTKSFYEITLFSALSMIGSFLYLLSKSANSFTLHIACLIIGIASAYQPVILSKITTYVSKNLSGTAAALGNMIIMSFGSFFHNVIGTMIDYSGAISIRHQGKIYGEYAYINGIAIIPIMLIFACIGFAIIIFLDYRNNRSNNKISNIVLQ